MLFFCTFAVIDTIIEIFDLPNMNIEKYVFPIFQQRDDGTIDSIGNGFFSGNLFFTAEHVVMPSLVAIGDPFIIIGNREIILTNKVELNYKSLDDDNEDHTYGHEDKDRTDFSVFILADIDINSPLRLATSFPARGQHLRCDFYHRIKDPFNPSHKKLNEESGHMYYWETTAIVESDEKYFVGNFFGAKMKPAHPKGGSSGSPLYDNNNIVYGILHVGKDDFCGFYAVAHANQLLRQSQISID